MNPFIRTLRGITMQPIYPVWNLLMAVLLAVVIPLDWHAGYHKFAFALVFLALWNAVVAVVGLLRR